MRAGGTCPALKCGAGPGVLPGCPGILSPPSLRRFGRARLPRNEGERIMEQGTLFVKLESAREALPVQGRVVISQTVNGVRVLEIELVTDEDGLTQPVTLDAPDRSISLDPASTQQAWAAYDVEAYADGYSDILLEGVQVYSGVEAYAPISMLPIFSSQAVSPTAVTADTGSTSREAQQDILHTTIPAPAIRGGSASGPAPLSTCATQPLVLQSVFIPQYITVHLGKPQNSAANETVSFPYYIKNVCSSEIYPTWPENAIRANIYAQISLALNRVYTEWYPSKGYNFNITNSTQYDQYYVSGRNIFTNISRIVDDIFNTYLRRVGDFAPYYAEYCNGTTVTCKGMSQWGTVSLAESGLSPIQILRRYYGNNFELVTTNDIRAIPSSYPGTPLRLGSTGNNVSIIQRQLNRIAKNYPAIGQQSVDGVFGATTQSAVRTFQKIFNLTQDGVVGKSTWYKISYIYVAVKKLAELGSESEPYPGGSGDAPGSGTGSIQQGAVGAQVAAVQYYLSYLAQTFYPTIPNIVPDGIFGAQTRSAVIAFQNTFGLTADGIVGPATWAALEKQFETAYDDNNPGSYFGAYPGVVLREGNRGLRVQQMQFYLLYLHYSYSSIPKINADGIFGPATTAAVRAFQAKFGLTQDGVVGLATWTELYSIYSQKNALVLSDEQVPAYPGFVLRRGSQGQAVLGVQTYLNVISRKYASVTPLTRDGNFDSRTEVSVRAFQRQFKLTITGWVDEPTRNRIYSEYKNTLLSEHLECRFIDVPYPGEPVEVGQTNIFVRTALYYYNLIAAFDLLLEPTDINDTFTLEDSLAIEEFQRTRGLTVTGVIDEDTWTLLYYQYVAAYQDVFPNCAAQGSVPQPSQTLVPGSRGVAVEQLQIWINALSAYYCDLVPQDVTGIYDEATESNVFILQTLLDLPLTGEVDQTTWNLIQEAYEEALAENNNGEEAYGDLLDVTYINRTISMTETVLCAGNCGTPLD